MAFMRMRFGSELGTDVSGGFIACDFRFGVRASEQSLSFGTDRGWPRLFRCFPAALGSFLDFNDASLMNHDLHARDTKDALCL